MNIKQMARETREQLLQVMLDENRDMDDGAIKWAYDRGCEAGARAFLEYARGHKYVDYGPVNIGDMVLLSDLEAWFKEGAE